MEDKEIKKELHAILNDLYDAKYNRIYSEDLGEKYKNFLEIVKTLSINKGFISYHIPYTFLTDKGIEYVEYMRMSVLKKLFYNFQKWSGAWGIVISIIAAIISIITLV
ncbi:hypothetical protein D8B46_10065, partial [Candidatus Gracilibacteria bacterium]